MPIGPGNEIQHYQWWTRQEGGQISSVDTGSVFRRCRHGQERWMNRWKPALNAFAITFEGRLF
jgi:hypothetical protein